MGRWDDCRSGHEVRQRKEALGSIESDHAIRKEPLFFVEEDVEENRSGNKCCIDDDFVDEEIVKRWVILDDAQAFSGDQCLNVKSDSKQALNGEIAKPTAGSTSHPPMAFRSLAGL